MKIEGGFKKLEENADFSEEYEPVEKENKELRAAVHILLITEGIFLLPYILMFSVEYVPFPFIVFYVPFLAMWAMPGMLLYAMGGIPAVVILAGLTILLTAVYVYKERLSEASMVLLLEFAVYIFGFMAYIYWIKKGFFLPI